MGLLEVRRPRKGGISAAASDKLQFFSFGLVPWNLQEKKITFYMKPPPFSIWNTTFPKVHESEGREKNDSK